MQTADNQSFIAIICQTQERGALTLMLLDFTVYFILILYRLTFISPSKSANCSSNEPIVPVSKAMRQVSIRNSFLSLTV